ncbi:MAG: polyprenyl synthetase family protein, partial [Arsenophonus sp. ET-DL12-MAG3]
MNLESIINLIANDMEEVNKTILDQLNSDIHLINQLGQYIINGGGKKIRSMITILSGKALGYQREKHINVAALIEFIHTATLLHDDVIDKSTLRRGKKTANAVFGNAASILVGDFIYTRSFQMMTKLDSMPILKLMSD